MVLEKIFSKKPLLACAAILVGSVGLSLKLSPPPLAGSAHWVLEDEEETPCPIPFGLCSWNLQFNNFPDAPGNVAGIVFQQVRRSYNWIGCLPNPPTGVGGATYYERFYVLALSDGTSWYIKENDTFTTAAIGDNTEYVDTAIGTSIFVPLNAATQSWLTKLGNLKFRGPVRDENDSNKLVNMTIPSGTTPFTSGGIPNQTNKPTITQGGQTYSWDNNFGGNGVQIPDHRLEWNHICCPMEKWHVLECN